jgi:hypothetical protein
MKIIKSTCSVQREPLKAPFGFKGRFVSELWQTIASLESDRGSCGLGLGTQSPLWSDAGLFSAMPESDSNRLMLAVTEDALKLAETKQWSTPIDLLDQLLPDVYENAKNSTHRKDLRLTFVLNALVALDNAAWQLYCQEMKISQFDKMIPTEMAPSLSQRQTQLTCIPLISYNVSCEQIKAEIEAGHFLLKIKIGSDPDQDGDFDKMLTWDKARLTEIHNLAKGMQTPYTESGHLPYYLDANGRYDSKERLMGLIEHADSIGALERIVIVEEPFPEDYRIDVSDIPLRLAADESAHSDRDALERIDLGYSAIALKPIAKTLSMSLKIARLAHEKSVPCFCADLTVNPILVDWNKSVAARLAPFPGVKVGILESNGHQNYKNWETLKKHHPCSGAAWMDIQNGMFNLDDDFYARSGGILQTSPYYLDILKTK